MSKKLLSAREYYNKVGLPNFLYKNTWKQHTTTLLHAPRDTDKTALALSIAAELTVDGIETVYVACDPRIDLHMAALANAPTLLGICVPEFESPDDKTDYADLVISTIEDIVKTSCYRTFIIDSVTRIAALSFGKNASVAYVMKRLVALQVRYKLSLMVISHDSTKSTDRALLNLADSEITIEVPEEDKKPKSAKQKTVATADSPDRLLRRDSLKVLDFSSPDYSWYTSRWKLGSITSSAVRLG